MLEERSDGTIVLIDGDTSIVIDERARPVIITTWFGEATTGIIDQYFDWFGMRLARARAVGERLVLVNDTFAIERPTPVVRRRLAERTKEQLGELMRPVIGSVVVIESALVRGAVTALGWILPSLADTHFFSTFDEAIAHGLVMLDQAGVPRPSGSWSNYRRPPRPS